MIIINFRGDLTDNSAKNVALCFTHMGSRQFRHLTLSSTFMLTESNNSKDALGFGERRLGRSTGMSQQPDTLGATHAPSSEFVLAEISVRSSRKSFVFIIIVCVCTEFRLAQNIKFNFDNKSLVSGLMRIRDA